MSKPTLFGTDGIRGKAGSYPMTVEVALQTAQAAADVLVVDEKNAGLEWPIVVIGKDSRQSGDMFEAAAAAGLNSRGVDVRLAGVVPTPAVARLVRELNAAFGIVISASHNPFPDNGIKFFGPDGYKLEDETEWAIEEKLLSGAETKVSPAAEEGLKIGRTAPLENGAERYVNFVASGRDSSLLSGMKIALDAANGAASQTSPEILEALGAEVLLFHAEPNGLNINDNCGCTHPREIEKLVKETGADAGVTHDGDADRVLLCDEKGKVLDGDELMAIAAISMLAGGSLQHDTLVATVMSNGGLDEAVKNAGGKVVRTGVGDRNVVQAMKKGGYNLGGEQSGHFVFRDINTTGDGIVAAVELLAIVRQSGKPLSELRGMMTRFPQVQRNVSVSRRPDLEEIQALAALLLKTKSKLGDSGRVLARYSGTEPLLRILIEGRDKDWITKKIDEIAEVATEELG